jgi:hypothetical protein
MHIKFPRVWQPRTYEVGPVAQRPDFRVLCVECGGGGVGVNPAFGRLGPRYNARAVFYAATDQQVNVATWNF